MTARAIFFGVEAEIAADGGDAFKGHLAAGAGEAAGDGTGEPPAEDAAERHGQEEAGEDQVEGTGGNLETQMENEKHAGKKTGVGVKLELVSRGKKREKGELFLAL